MTNTTLESENLQIIYTPGDLVMAVILTLGESRRRQWANLIPLPSVVLIPKYINGLILDLAFDESVSNICQYNEV